MSTDRKLITAKDVTEVVRVSTIEATHAFGGFGEGNQSAADVLRTLSGFLEEEHVLRSLKNYLERVQPHRQDPAMSLLTLKEFEILCGKMRPDVQYYSLRGNPPRLVSVEFCGISYRGSYTYDLTVVGKPTPVRVYVRPDNDGLARVELYENDFELPVYVAPPSEIEKTKQDYDKPVSALGRFFKKHRT